LSITPLTGILNPLHHSIQVAQHERKTQPLRFHPTASIQLFYPRGSPEKLSNSEFTIAGFTLAESEAASVGLSHPYYWAPFILIGNPL
jgi:hypothetical protein